ncbi:MAG TPA: TlpA family protein disulfide reductase [Arcobacter sp.]|nr:TlpA family protein disulfide reductase [Arcobacter sp.]
MINNILLTIILSIQLFSSESLTINFGDDEELQVLQYKNKSNELLVILPSEHGITDGLKILAKDLQKNNTEVWIADPYSSWFLPAVESSLSKIPLDAYVATIKEAIKTNKKVYLFSNDKASALVLRTINKWQHKSKDLLAGVILLSPNLYSKTPTAGNEGKLLAIASATNISLKLLIPSKSTLALRIEDTLKALKKSGSNVSVNILENVRDRFYFRDDSSIDENKMALVFASIIKNSMKDTIKTSKVRDAVSISKNIVKKKKKDNTRRLNKYDGKLLARDFTLKDINKKSHTLSKYKGKIVLLNFWASWCPPCVHEMPSMSDLMEDLKSQDVPFEILAVNLGEDEFEMSEFLDEHDVSFTVLLDPPKDIAKQWKVYAFPTTYIIDKKGAIRYSVAGGFDWNTQSVKDLLKTLASEK